MWRLRFFLENLGWRSVAIGAAAVVVALVAAGVAFALMRGGDDTSATTSETSAPEESTNLYYLRAVAPKTRVRGCSMFITFTWKPDYHADQYIDAPALITASGTGIQGTYRKRFTESGMSYRTRPRLARRRVSALVGESDRARPGSARKRHDHHGRAACRQQV